MKRFTEKSDDAYDKRKGIKDGSKRDLALDKKRGLPVDAPKRGAKKGRK